MSDNKFYKGYDAGAIVISDNVEKHRRNPAQYLSSSGASGITNQFTEFLFNALDEVNEAHAWAEKIYQEHRGIHERLRPFVVDVTITAEDEVTISDMGRGMPCGIHPTTGEPAIFSLFENDSAGAKGNFSQDGYSSEGTSGMHGAGAAVSKSCTEIMNVRVKDGNEKAEYLLRYVRGYRDEELGLHKVGDIKPHPYEELAEIGFYDTGTSITYKYDPTVLEAKRDGIPVPAYVKDDIVNIIQMYLLGVSNKDRIRVNLTFHGETQTISPHDLTPEMYLGVSANSKNLLKIPVQRDTGNINDKSNFSGTLYLVFDENNYMFKVNTVVNKLFQRITKHDTVLEQVIGQTIMSLLKTWVKQGGDKLIVPRATDIRPASKFRALLIMDLPVAEFGGQTKDRLESDAYIGALRLQTENYFISSDGLATSGAMKFFEEEIKLHTKLQKKLQQDEEQKKKRELKRKQLAEEDKTINLLANDLYARLEEEDRSAFSLDIKRPSSISYPNCAVCFFEGVSANTVVNDALAQGHQIVSVVTKGKLPNIQSNPEKITESRIRQLRIDIFSKEFDRYIIFVDPDADGTHIRTQLLKIIERFRPDMLERGKVYVCRAPYGKVAVGQEPIEINTTVEGKRILNTGENFVLSYEELEQAMNKGASKIETYNGALDVISKCKHQLPFTKLISDPKYLVKIQPPSQADLELLDDVLSPKSDVRSSVTRRMYTERQRYSKYIARQAQKNKLGLKVNEINQSINKPTVCRVTDKPRIQDVYKHRLPF